MIELALGSWEACIFALFFAVLYLIIYIPYRKRKSRIGKKVDMPLLFLVQILQNKAEEREEDGNI